MEGIIQPLPASNARRSPLITPLSPSQLRRAELAEARARSEVATTPRRNESVETVAAGTACRRCEDWPEKLRDFLEAQADKTFDWAQWNCCHFARAWVQELTGIDLDNGFLGACTGLLTAQRILQRKGGVAGLFARACNRHGFSQVHRYYAARGDLVLFKDAEAVTAVGICCGESFAAVGPSGIEYRDMAQATHAFKIG